MLLNIGHRGARGLVTFENTLESFQKAKECGAWGIEFDVRRTLDGIFVIWHDEDFFSLPIKLNLFETLKNEASLKGFDLCTLEKIFLTFKNSLFYDIELKEGGYEKDVLREIKKYLHYKDYMITSFKGESLERLSKLDPLVDLGLLLDTEIFKEKKISSLKEGFKMAYDMIKLCPRKVDTILPCSSIINPFLLKYCRYFHKKVWVWTVNEEDEMRRLKKCGVDAIITDRPDILQKLLNQK